MAFRYRTFHPSVLPQCDSKSVSYLSAVYITPINCHSGPPNMTQIGAKHRKNIAMGLNPRRDAIQYYMGLRPPQFSPNSKTLGTGEPCQILRSRVTEVKGFPSCASGTGWRFSAELRAHVLGCHVVYRNSIRASCDPLIASELLYLSLVVSSTFLRYSQNHPSIRYSAITTQPARSLGSPSAPGSRRQNVSLHPRPVRSFQTRRADLPPSRSAS